MELGAILLLLVVLVIIILFVVQPFNEHWRIKVQSPRELSSLLAERERALNALQELDFDYGLGKVPQDEYSNQRASLLEKGSAVLRRLDQIKSVVPESAQEPAIHTMAEKHASQLSDEDLEDLVAKRRGERRQKTGGFCPKCGKPIMQSDQYCPACGLMIYSK